MLLSLQVDGTARDRMVDFFGKRLAVVDEGAKQIIAMLQMHARSPAHGAAGGGIKEMLGLC